MGPRTTARLRDRLRADIRRGALRRREEARLRGDRGEAARRAVPSEPPADGRNIEKFFFATVAYAK